MLRAALFFFLMGLIAMGFGAYNFAGVSIDAAKVLLLVFFVLGVLSVLGNVIAGRKTTSLT